MSSAATPHLPITRVSSSLLREIRASYRRVCVLRASHRESEADNLLIGKVSGLVTRALESGQTSATEIETLFTTEELRVEEAHALAELLLPLLTSALGHNQRGEGVESARENARAERPRPAPSSVATQSPPTAPAESKTSDAVPPGIADFIDEMLTQDRATQEAAPFRRPA